MKIAYPIFIYTIILTFAIPTYSWGQIQLPDLFSDHLVLQRDLPIPIWGTAEVNVQVDICLSNHKVTVYSNNIGKWKATLPVMDAGGAYEMIIATAKDTVRINDIYIGEVWFCSGQSNMEFPLAATAEGEAEIPQAKFPKIRLYQLKKKHDTYKTPYTQEQLEAFSDGHFFHKPKWELCSPETASKFSGVAYFYGKALHQSLGVPIGLIQAAVGGSPCQSWVSKEALASHPQLKHLADENQRWIDSKIIHPWLAERAQQNWENWETQETAKLPGHPFAPSYLFDTAINTIAPYAIRGAIWYQGESNATHPSSYRAMQEMLLKSWRTRWGQGDFPFYYVQLPRIGDRNLWAEFRKTQQQCLSYNNTGMIVTIDQGHPTDVHPKEKKVIGLRLANLALANTYSQDIPAESPMLDYKHWNPSDHKIVLRFEHTYEGLKTRNGKLPSGFYLQGYIENGSIETIIPPETIIISNDEITITYPLNFLPVKVKYAWAPYPENNLINSAGLPVAPFKIELEGIN